MVAGGTGKTRGRERERERMTKGGWEREWETRRHAFRRQLWELRRNTPVSVGPCAWCPRMVHARWEIGCDPRWDVGAKVQWKAPVEETPPGTTAAFCGGATVTAKALPPRASTLSGVGVGCAMHPYICIIRV